MSVDWPLVLEFLKVLASPAATLTAAFLVAHFAVRTFRRQKALERRLDWHERAVRLLSKTADLAMEYRAALELKFPESAVTFLSALLSSRAELFALFADAEIYATQDAYDEIQGFLKKLDTLSARMNGLQPGEELQWAKEFIRLCLDAERSLAKDARLVMYLPPLRRDRQLPPA